MKSIFLIVLHFFAFQCRAEKYDSIFGLLDKRAHDIIHTGKISDMKPLTDTMIMIYKQAHNEVYLATANAWLGSYYNEIGDFTSSQRELFEALDFFEKADDMYGICFTEKEIGAFFKYIDHYDEAIKHLNRSLSALNEALKDKRSISTNIDNRIYTHIAECYLKKKQFNHEKISRDTIDYYVNKSIQSRSDVDDYSVCRTLFIQSMQHYSDNPLVAEAYLQQCLTRAAKNLVSIPYMEASFFYAKYLFTQKRFNYAKKYALLCNEKALLTNKKQFIIKSASLLYYIFSNLTNTPSNKDSAILYLKEKEIYTDSVINYYKAEQVEIRTTELNLRQAKEQEEIANEKAEIKTIIFWTLVIGAVSCFIFWLFYKLKKTPEKVTERKIYRVLIFSVFVVFELVIILTHSILEYQSFHPINIGLCVILIAISFEQLNHQIKVFFEKKYKELIKIKEERLKATIEKMQKQLNDYQQNSDDIETKL